MAGVCLGELVRKMGDRVLRQIIPILQTGMKDPSPATRVGVCTGLKELLQNISHSQLKENLSQLLPAVQSALVDSDADVRQVLNYLATYLQAVSLVNILRPANFARREENTQRARSAAQYSGGRSFAKSTRNTGVYYASDLSLIRILCNSRRLFIDTLLLRMQAAGAAFAVLFRGGGGSAVDSVVPSMLTALTNDTKQATQALQGLRVILSVRPQTLGTMLPRLLKPHVTPTSMRALAALAEVAGQLLNCSLSLKLGLPSGFSLCLR